MRTRVVLALLLLVLAATAAVWLTLPARDASSSGASASPSLVSASGSTTTTESLETPLRDATQTADALRPSPLLSPSALSVRAKASTGDDPAFVTVVVTSRDTGHPLAGARVSLNPQRSSHDVWVANDFAVDRVHVEPQTSDAQGRAQFDVPPRTDLEAWATGPQAGGDIPPGHASSAVRALEPGARIEISLALPTEADLTFVGHLVSAEDGTPIANGRVYLVREDGALLSDPQRGVVQPIPRTLIFGAPRSDDARRQVAVPDLAGFFEIRGASWDYSAARVDVPGRSMIDVVMDSKHPSAASALDIRLPRTARVNVTIVDGTGSALDQVRVSVATRPLVPRLQRSSVARTEEQGWRAITSRDGSCMLDDLPSGIALDVELASGNRVDRATDETLVLKPGEERKLSLAFGGTTSVRGRLIDHADAPFPNEVVWIRRTDKSAHDMFTHDDKVFAEARTDEQGAFVFERVAAGAWLVGPAAREILLPSRQIERTLAPVAQRVQVPERGIVDIVVRTDRGLSIRGRVVDAHGAPMPDASVTAKPVGESWGANAVSNRDGYFLVGPLVDGDYELTARAGPPRLDASHQRWSKPNYTRSAAVVAHSGAQDAVLTIHTGATVRFVAAAGDSANEDAVCRVLNSSGRCVGGTGLGGTIVVDAGTYSVFASAEGGLCGMRDNFEAREGETTDVVVALQQGARLRVKWDASAASIAEYQLWFEGKSIATRSAPGAPWEHTVPAGHVVIRWRSTDDQWTEQAVDVDAGETREIVLAKRS